MEIKVSIEQVCLLRMCTWGDVDVITLDRLLTLRDKLDLALEATPAEAELRLLDFGSFGFRRDKPLATYEIDIDLTAQEFSDLARGMACREKWGLERASRELADRIRALPAWLVAMQNTAVDYELVARLPEDRRRRLLGGDGYDQDHADDGHNVSEPMSGTKSAAD